MLGAVRKDVAIRVWPVEIEICDKGSAERSCRGVFPVLKDQSIT